MFSLFKRLVIAVEKIAANSMNKQDYLEFHSGLVEMQKIKSIEVLNIQLEHTQKELLFRAQYKNGKGLELTVDEQMALEKNKDNAIEQSALLHRAYYKKANGIALTEVEELSLKSHENKNQIN